MPSKITVLFVEDDEGVRKVLPDMLPAEDFQPIVVADGDQALRILTSQKIDVLVTDVVMAGLGGIELATQAKAMLPNLRIILMTGYLSRGNEAQEIGMLLYKPVRGVEMETAIRDAIAQ